MGKVWWIVTIVSIIGTVLNCRKDSRCFYLWIPANGILVGMNVITGNYPMALLFAVYFGLAIYGLVQWKKMLA